MGQDLKEKILLLRKQGLKYEDIQIQLGCAWSTISYHCKNAGISSNNRNRKPNDEEIEQWQLLYNTGLSIDSVAKEVGWNRATIRQYIETRHVIFRTPEEKQKLNVARVLERRREVKRKLVQYKGGKCERCGYNKCVRALEFHHRDPLEKEYTISVVSNSYETLRKEADKCDLVCSNCHREIEEEEFLKGGEA